MPALPSSLICSLSQQPPATVSQTAVGLPAALGYLPDPRARRGVRHRLTVVVSAAVCAVVAGCRSYVAIAEWVADAPAATVAALGMDPDRRPSEAMIRRLLQSLDPNLLTAAVSGWLANRLATAAPPTRRAVAVDGKTLRGSRSRDAPARHVMAALDQATGVALASTDVNGKTNEITRFQPLLDQISDLRETIVTLDALHCQRDHVAYLAERGAHWILTVKANQPSLHTQLAALPWRAVPQATRDEGRGHGRREIRTLKALTVQTPGGLGFPHAAQALQIRRRRRRLDQPKRFTTETVYAITSLNVHQARPAQLAAWIRGHWSIENKLHWVRDVTYDEDRSQIRTRTGPQVMAALRNAAIGILRITGVTNIAAANRHHARDSTRPLALLGIT
ncbi:ISAs1 family transposase [Natronosporangium hydrolyticum]|uniref:ISAs1 family transposase n=1 Tax=Natronosporangium hydrolyticum TaxID=2811111 RepID=A0A895YDC3_9ACTN|nr:ISAs1 family transposase [Natronosporangium hydrolyticum]QSB14172.1 ISAs1 family transposase [Natronosporangium hydrolyticum]